MEARVPSCCQSSSESGEDTCTLEDKPKCNFVDAIVALDLATGKPKWARRTVPCDAHTHACIDPSANTENCPSPIGPDYDFAQGPILYATKGQDFVGAGQKRGTFWALNPDNGKIIWRTQVGPGGMFGGMMWGSATDGERIYVANANSDQKPWSLRNQPQKHVVSGSFWSALNANNGDFIWQTPDPNQGSNRNALTVANGVVYVSSTSSGRYDRNMMALNAKTGSILWRHPAGGPVHGSPIIVDGMVYWGSDYGTDEPKYYLLAFGLDDKP